LIIASIFFMNFSSREHQWLRILILSIDLVLIFVF